jgi:hypothetical protein
LSSKSGPPHRHVIIEAPPSRAEGCILWASNNPVIPLRSSENGGGRIGNAEKAG